MQVGRSHLDCKQVAVVMKEQCVYVCNGPTVMLIWVSISCTKPAAVRWVCASPLVN